MKRIPITQGKFILVDDEDFCRVSEHKWYAQKTRSSDLFYARRDIWEGKKRVQRLALPNFILGIAGLIDHKDGDGLNNQKSNLRLASYRQNATGYRRKPASASSKFRGVYWNKRAAKWRAQIVINGETIYLGTFYAEHDAASAYDVAATKFFGEFACRNFPQSKN